MTYPNLRCTHCGANLTPQDMQNPDCPYCKTALPHHARAAEHAQLVSNMLADRDGDGVPDAYQPWVRNVMGGGPPAGSPAGPNLPGPPHGPPGGPPPVMAPTGMGASPPSWGAQAPAGPQMYGYDPNMPQQIMKSASRSIMIWVVASLVLTCVMTALIGGAVLFMMPR